MKFLKMEDLTTKGRVVAKEFLSKPRGVTHDELVSLTGLKGFEVDEALREMKSNFMVYKVPSLRLDNVWALTI